MKKALAVLLVILLASTQVDAAWFSTGDSLVSIFEDIDLNGPSIENVKRLEGYVDNNPQAEYIDEALLRLGRIYSEKKELNKAAEVYGLLIKNFPQSRFRNEASYELGLINYRTGRLDLARSALESVSRDNGASLQLRAKAARFLKEIEKAAYGLNAAQDLPAIGVLLPLKGDYASFGEDALSGILLAANVFGTAGSEVEVIVKDVSDPAKTGAAVQELSSNSRVAAIVGPLLSSTVMDAARHAQTNRVPVITLSQREGVTDAGDYVFRNFLTAGDQAVALAGYASSQLGAKRYAILYPQTSYGVELARHFEAAVKARGGVVVRQAAYPQGTADFSESIKRLFGVQVKERMEGRRKIREFNPSIKVDALFIPDSYEPIALIVPYLGYYNIKNVRLLGPSSWNSPRLVELAGGNVEGAVFVDGFFAGSSRSGAAEFTSRYSAAYGKQPGILSAQAYDAARMIMQASDSGLGDSGPGGRDELRKRLKSIREFNGATGTISFNARREAEKRLFILTVQGGRIVEAGN